MHPLGGTREYGWIGALRGAGGGWTWVDGTPWSYTAWAAGEPDPGDTHVVLYGEGGAGTFSDSYGHYEKYYYCQYTP